MTSSREWHLLKGTRLFRATYRNSSGLVGLMMNDGRRRSYWNEIGAARANIPPDFTRRKESLAQLRRFSLFEGRSASPLYNAVDSDSANGTNDSFTLRQGDEDKVTEEPPSNSIEVSSLRRESIVPLDVNHSLESVSGLELEQNKEKDVSPPSYSYDDMLIPDKKATRKFYINDVESTIKELLQHEDTNHDSKITIEDTGPKVLRLGTVNSDGYRSKLIRGTYMLSNLLQELTIAAREGKTQLILSEETLNENPVFKLKRQITEYYWTNLTREINEDTIASMAADTKVKDEITDENGNVLGYKESCRIYVPYNREDHYHYFKNMVKDKPEMELDIQYLPKDITPEYVRSINKRPGLLSLAMKPDPADKTKFISEPYVVPGGRFNEFYGWDSYMESLGLLLDVSPGKNLHLLRLARGMAENFIFEINHYGKILNANRTYYLTRSQPPFLTDMCIRIFKKTMEVYPENEVDSKDFLERATEAAIKEYETVWCAEPRLDKKTGLSCYHPVAKGIPPETESSHFDIVLRPYLERYGVTREAFLELYNLDKIHEPDLDEYFLNDRAVRESGHDTSYRLEGKAAHLATVDLNSLLYKYEVDVVYILNDLLHEKLKNPVSGEIESLEKWQERSEKRKANITKYLWCEEDNIFYDYNVVTGEQTRYESATSLWPLWSGAASRDQAERLVKYSLQKFEQFGGLAAGTLKSRGPVNLFRPSRQWDFPYGWAPQQILAWYGLKNYGFHNCVRRLVYRWLYLITRAFVDYNGVIVEKYNVCRGAVPHKVDAEYGNQGINFKGVQTEGFGWVNASFVIGLSLMNLHSKRNLGTLTPPDVFLNTLPESQVDAFN